MGLGVLLSFGFGFALLVLGALWLVKGAARLALGLGVSPLVVGLTVVAYGTSAPELAVSVEAARSGRADIALGNVVGSNILNVLLVLGGSALIAPLAVARQLVRLDVPILVGLSGLVYVMAHAGRIGHGAGALLVALAAAYT
ncbi:MAG TPA: sodium:calcium antiporter, partial [Vicinamibacteria bacterium]|nr:sodium:calcium antiporter [Vicinamibacteria bacterium]